MTVAGGEVKGVGLRLVGLVGVKPPETAVGLQKFGRILALGAALAIPVAALGIEGMS